MFKMFIEQVVDNETLVEVIQTYNDRDELQQAQNDSIANWIDIQGKYARITTEPDGGLILKVHGNSDREIWKRIS